MELDLQYAIARMSINYMGISNNPFFEANIR
jgi:hypothetical protein